MVTPAEPSDRNLLAAMARGDTGALRSLNARYGGRLAALANRFLGDQADAEEVAADVLWQAWRQAASFDPARGSVASWLVTIARSRSLDRLRARQARRAPAIADADSEPVADPAAALDEAHRGRMVRRAIDGLEANQRVVLEMAYFSDLSHAEIAEKLSMPLGTVKTRVRSAMLSLRQALGGQRE